MARSQLYGKPGYLIRRVQQIAYALFMEECGDHGLTPVQYASLRAIRETPGLDATRLSAIVAFDRSTLGDVLERLEGKGWIVRTSSPTDKRLKLLGLTRNGRARLDAVEPAVARCQDRILEPLKPADRPKFLQLLRHLVASYDRSSTAPPVPGDRS